jgi:hypothetical protein
LILAFFLASGGGKTCHVVKVVCTGKTEKSYRQDDHNF